MVNSAAFTLDGAARPPTPPKEHNDAIEEAIGLLKVDFSVSNTKEQPTKGLSTVNTPPPSSPSSQDTSRSRTTKKVDFCAWTEQHENTTSTGSSKDRPYLRRLPLSQQTSKPLRSILKISNQTPTPDETGSPAPDYFAQDNVQDPVKMLESVLKMLASPVRSMRLDGYRTLNGALKAHDDFPDKESLRSKVTQLTHFVSRDVRMEIKEASDSVLITQALKLTTALFLMPGLGARFTDEFQAILLDKAVASLEQSEVIKSIANHYMYMIAANSFHPRTVTSVKAERLVHALEAIEQRISGNSVIASRLTMYERLIEHQPALMLSRIRHWLKHIFHGVLSNHNDIRSRAIATGIKAGLALGHSYAATKALVEHFGTETKTGGSYGDYLIARLADMSSSKDTRQFVPQIWGMVVLFFRTKKGGITSWPAFRQWLAILQRCLNTSDFHTKYEAIMGWSRLIFALDLDQSLLDPVLSIVPMLKVPFTSILEQRPSDARHTREVRQIAKAGYCNLLHYALRPSQSYQELDYFWNEYAQSVLPKLLMHGGKDARFACDILKALFKGKTTTWNANRGNEPLPMRTDEIVQLVHMDAKWLRRRVQDILTLLEPYLVSFLRGSDDFKLEHTPWLELLAALADAGSQEVRASIELRETLAHIVNFFERLWTELMTSFTEDAVRRYGELVVNAVKTLGPLHFTEENLAMKQGNRFEPAPTPSSRTAKDHLSLCCPIVFLFNLFLQRPVSAQSAVFDETARSVLDSTLSSMASAKAALSLIRRCVPDMQAYLESPESAKAAASLWNVLAVRSISAFNNPPTDTAAQDSQSLGAIAHHTIALLKASIANDSVATETVQQGQALLTAAVAALRHHQVGDTAASMGLAEPLAKILLGQKALITPAVLVAYTSLVLRFIELGPPQQNIDRARKLLHGPNVAHIRQGSPEHLDDVYKLADAALMTLSEQTEQVSDDVEPLMLSCRRLLLSCPGVSVSTLLRRIQPGISGLIRHADARITTNMLSLLWDPVIEVLANQPRNSLLLKAFASLFIAGFSSDRQDIVNKTVLMWNEVFGELGELDYPADLVPVLRRLRDYADLRLPTFPESESDQIEPELPVLTIAHTDAADHTREELDVVKPRFGWHTASPLRASLRRGSPGPAPAALTVNDKVQRATTPKIPLRHDDSQVDFVPIQDSSPTSRDEDESQALTDHQREVIERQHSEAAQMYADFSSSPLPTSEKASRISKLDFQQSGSSERERTGTPEPARDDVDDGDGYLGSSPTTRSASKARTNPQSLSNAYETAGEGLFNPLDEDEIPSSPPEMEDDGIADVVMEEPAIADAVQEPLEQNAAVEQADVLQPADSVNHNRPEDIEEDVDADVVMEGTTIAEDVVNVMEQELEDAPQPADAVSSNPPTNIENETIAAQEVSENEDESGHDMANADGSPAFAEVQASPAMNAQTEGTKETQADVLSQKPQTQNTSPESEENVSDSFLQTAISDEVNDNATTVVDKDLPSDVLEGPPDSEMATTRRSAAASGRASRSASAKKRKQPPTKVVTYASKCRKLTSQPHPSPSPEAESERDDIEDCITVTPRSSQVLTDDKPENGLREPVIVKRKPGRPRKNQPTSADTSQIPASHMKSNANASRSKRKSSEMEGLFTLLGDETIVQDTPAPTKSRKLNKDQDAKTAQDDGQRVTKATQLSGRELRAVVIPAANVEVDHDGSDEPSTPSSQSVEHAASPDRQLLDEHMAALAQTQTSPSKTKQISRFLSWIWDELKTVVISSQEEREMDDRLFQIRREVHNAAERGRR